MTKRPEDEDWEFSKVLTNSDNGPEVSKTKSEIKIIRKKNKRERKLVLDEAPIPRTKTRSAMAIELQEKKDNSLRDEFTYAPLYKRGLAFILDCVFLGTLLYAVKFSSPLWRQLIKYFMDSYNLKFLISESLVMKGVYFISGFISLFFCIVIPVSFFNLSFGKKLLGLRIRGVDKYTISLSEAFNRELIAKPISILLIAGFVTPFLSKKRLSVHDMITDTFVIEE